MNTSVDTFVPSDDEENKVKAIVTKDGETIEADLVVLGIGTTPNTEIFKDSDLALTETGHIKVSSNMETNLTDVYAAGDIAKFPLVCAGRSSFSIGHWGLAMSLGKCAALNAAGKYQHFEFMLEK